MAMLIPLFLQPITGAAQGRTERSYVATLDDEQLFPGMPTTVPGGTNLESDAIYVQGFNSFQVWLQAAGPGTITFAYGICHPRSTPQNAPVVSYRAVFTAQVAAASMLASFGAVGQVVALQADLYTAFTLRLTAVGGAVTFSRAALWCGVR